MDDEEYARELFAILTASPGEPVDAYGTAADRIDRYGGFGTEVRVTSIDVVPGPYGAQIQVGFVLDLPHDVDLPDRGTFLLPVDREWRELSGYAQPEDYAPRVAFHTEQAVRRHISAHKPRDRAHDNLPDRAAQHDLLLAVLGRYGDVYEQGADRYVVRRGGEDRLTVLVSPDEWEQVLRRNGTPDHVDFFEETVASTPRDERFFVFWDGDLVSSTREELPPLKIPGPTLRETRRRIAEAEATGQDLGWFAYTPGSTDRELPG